MSVDTAIHKITCHKCNRGDSGLRRDGQNEDGITQYICWKCWDEAQGIQRRKSPGHPVLCPKCGEELMNRRRGGRISISKAKMKGKVTVLECECGFKKTVKNPFGNNPRKGFR